MEKLSDRFMYYCGLLAPHGVSVDDLKHIQNLIDKQEQGLLIELPCKVGDTVYALTPFCEICEEDLDYSYTCKNCSKGNFVSETKFDYEMIPMFGKAVFLTRSEAESALAKMGGKA